MTAYRIGPKPRRVFKRPTYVNTTLWAPRPHPELRWLRAWQASSVTKAGPIIGIALVHKRQRVIQWAVMR